MIDERIRIALFAGSFRYGGTERYLLQLLQNLDRRRFDPRIMCFYRSGELLTEVEKLNMDIHVFPLKNSFFKLTGIKALLRTASVLRKDRVMILYTLGDWANFIGVPAGRLAGVPVIIAGQRNMGHWMVRKRYRLGSKLIYKYLAHGVLVNANAIKTRLVNEFKIQSERIRVIHNGISINGISDSIYRIEGREDKTLVGFVGRFHPVKGLDLLIEAASEVVKKHPRTVFLIVGDGPNGEEYKAKIGKDGLKEHFLFTGYQENVFPYLNTIDFLVLPSRSEGFPNVVLEAMACGKAVVAARVGGGPEVLIEGKTGLLVDQDDVKGLAHAVGRLCKDDVLRKTMGIEGRRRVEGHFEIGPMVTEHERYFRAVLEKVAGDSWRNIE